MLRRKTDSPPPAPAPARSLAAVAADLDALLTAHAAEIAALATAVETEQARLLAVDAAFAAEQARADAAITQGLAAGDMATVQSAREAWATLDLQRGQVQVDLKAAALQHAEELNSCYRRRRDQAQPLVTEFEALFGEALALRDRLAALWRQVDNEATRYVDNRELAYREWEAARTALTARLHQTSA
jgi:hypothetical protein